MMHNERPISDFFAPGVRAHLVGIGGVSMCPLAEVLRDKGLRIQGSDGLYVHQAGANPLFNAQEHFYDQAYSGGWAVPVETEETPAIPEGPVREAPDAPAAAAVPAETPNPSAAPPGMPEAPPEPQKAAPPPVRIEKPLQTAPAPVKRAGFLARLRRKG